MRRLTAVIILGLFTFCAVVQPAVAQTQKITASEVVDAETLEAFVLYAKSHAEAFTDPNELAPYLHSISIEGDWKHGNTYLIIMLPDGTVFHHAGDISVNGKHLYDIEDARGNKVVQNLIAAANMGGGHVEYYWDDPAMEGDEDTPKVAYAVNYTSGIAGTTVVLIGGYYQDVSHASATPFDPSLIPPPDVTAADVVDRKTLKAFVQGTGNRYLKAIEQVGLDIL
ncbi:MAG: cache domain-containing protein, partial [Gemmatimonadota bacterium]|nr:cache domain-containing protein [Gemmatimonadota bacterium]